MVPQCPPLAVFARFEWPLASQVGCFDKFVIEATVNDANWSFLCSSMNGATVFGEVDLNKHGVSAYLVKIPEFIFKELEDAREGPDSEKTIGRLRVPCPESLEPAPVAEEDGDSDITRIPPARVFVDRLTKSQTDNPREFELMFPDNPTDIFLYSWKPQGDDPDVRAEGRVLYQCDMRPPLNDSYRNINRRRVEDAAQKSRETVYMDEGERIAAQNKSIRVTAMIETTSQREERQKKKETARRHLDVPDDQWREAAKVAIFRAFETKLHYSADHLARDIDEPVSRLRPVINELCFYNKSGPFSGKYELKDEFKTVAQRQQKERELEDHRIATIEDIKRRREERAQNERERSEPTLKRTRYQ